jgi:hypothetical protein
LTPEYENLKKEIVQAVLPYAKSESAAVRAAVARSMPTTNLDELNGILEGMALDADPMVRLMWSRRASQLALKVGETGRNAMALMEKQVAAEQDEMVKDWLEISLAETRKKYDELNK